MKQIAFATIALFLASSGLLAQSNSDQFPDTDSLNKLGKIFEGVQEPPTSPPVIRAIANSVELSAIDVLAGNLRILINPNTAFKYWPEYLYDSTEVTDSDLCRSTDKMKYKLETIAFVADAKVVDTISNDFKPANQTEYIGEAIFLPKYTDNNVYNMDSWRMNWEPRLQDLCTWIEQKQEDLPDKPDLLFFATGRVLPDFDLEIHDRVDLEFDSQAWLRLKEQSVPSDAQSLN